MLALPEADSDLEEGGKVYDGWSQPEGSQKQIEQVGKAYEALKLKYHKLAQRMEMGASAQFDESDSESDQEEGKEEEELDASRKAEFEKKRKTKTKEQIEAEALAGDLYGLLGLEDKKSEAGENDINKAYKKLAL